MDFPHTHHPWPHTRARFFGPEIGGLIFNSPLDSNIFRIDATTFESTSNVRYQQKRNGPWASLTWRYDSGAVAGAVPNLAAVYALTGDEQQSIGFHCGSSYAQVGFPINSCPGGECDGHAVVIPAPGLRTTTTIRRVSPRVLFDAGIGDDNVFHTERPRYRVQFTVVNITSKEALYNFLSTFSGTHFCQPAGLYS